MPAPLQGILVLDLSRVLAGRCCTMHGNAHPQIVPYRCFSASDGDFVLACGAHRQFTRLIRLPSTVYRLPSS